LTEQHDELWTCTSWYGRNMKSACTLVICAVSFEASAYACGWERYIVLFVAVGLEQPPFPWSIQQQSTVLLSDAAVLILASLTLPSTTPCELWLDACALHQRIIFQSSQAPRCWASSQWSHTVSSTPCHGAWTSAPLSAHPSIECKCTASEIETPICTSLHNNSWVHLTTKSIVVRRRTVVRNSSREGLYICAGGLGIWKCIKLHRFIVFHLSIWGYCSFVSGG